jgi:hypothetical protein
MNSRKLVMVVNGKMIVTRGSTRFIKEELAKNHDHQGSKTID